MTVAEARPRLSDFIDYSLKQGLTCVRIVHGKGLGSGHRGPVLKIAVNRWLRKWDSVLAFVSARQVDGGTGAVYVLLDRGDFELKPQEAGSPIILRTFLDVRLASRKPAHNEGNFRQHNSQTNQNRHCDNDDRHHCCGPTS